MKKLILLAALILMTHFKMMSQTTIPTDLILNFPLNGSAEELSEDKHTGIIVGNVCATTDRFGNPSSAMLFDGITGYIDIPFQKSIDTADFSVSFWACPKTDNIGYVFTKEQSSITINQFRMGGSGAYSAYFSNTDNSLGHALEFTPAKESWALYTVTRQGQSFKMYVNAVLQSAFETEGIISHSNNLNYRIGATYNSKTFFNGKIDDLKMYKHALTASEIEAMYAYPLSVNMTCEAGQLASLSTDYAASVKNLILTGNIDARDVKTLRDKMMQLENLDLSGVSIVSYSGRMGTSTGVMDYPANEMPTSSFMDTATGKGKSSIKTVVFPTTLTSIGDRSFYGCNDLIGNLSIPLGVNHIGVKAFGHCKKISGTLTLPEGMTNLGEAAFEYCSSLTGVLNLPNGLTSVGNNAFSNCTGISGLTIPNSIKSLGDRAFISCTSLTGIECLGITPPALGTSCFDSCKHLISDVYVPSEDAEAIYKTDGSWSDCFPGSTIKNSIKSVVSSIETKKARVYAKGSTIYIDGTNAGEHVAIYSAHGVMLETTQSDGVQLAFNEDNNAVYFVKTGSKTFKMIL